MTETTYPLKMKHPSFAPAVVADDSFNLNTGMATQSQGRPALWAPVTVNNVSQEELYRNKGYVGETEAFPVVETNYIEYPMALRHPDHKDATAPSYDMVKVDGELKTIPIPGEPEQYPDKLVSSPEEEEEWIERGWYRPGNADAIAFDKAFTSPGMPGDKYPMLVDGVLVHDPDAPPPPLDTFPMWIEEKQRAVKDPAEYRAVMGKPYVNPKDHPMEAEPKAAAEPEPDELAEFRAWKAAQAKVDEPEPIEPELPEIDLLRRELDVIGIAYDKRWGVKKLRNALDVKAA